MSQQQINLKEKSVVELKATAYDLSIIMQNYSSVLQAIQQELQQRAQEELAAQASAAAAEEGIGALAE